MATPIKMKVENLYVLRPIRGTAAENEQLLRSITERGIKKPLIVNGQGLVIDGARRLQIARQLNLGEVPAIVSDELEEIMEQVRINMDHKPGLAELDHYRAWYLYQDIRGYSRSGPGTARGKFPELRLYIADVLQVGPRYIQDVAYVMRRAYQSSGKEQQLALRALALVDDGTLRMSVAALRLRQWLKSDGWEVEDVDDQVTILHNGLANVVTALSTIDRIKELNEQISSEKIDEYLAQVARIHSLISLLRNRLKRSPNHKETE